MTARTAGRGIGGSRIFGALLLALWLTIAIISIQLGADYYRLPLGDRRFVPDQEVLKPSGLIGHGYEIAGIAMMLIGVIHYSSRKRVSWLASAGGLGKRSAPQLFHVRPELLQDHVDHRHAQKKYQERD